MRLLVLLAFAIVVSASPEPLSREFASRATAFPARAFVQWTGFNTKSYRSPEERSYRFQIWQDNLKFVNEFNAQNRSYWLAMTRFADLTDVEMRSHTGFEGCTNVTRSEQAILSHRMDPSPLQGSPPASVDWRSKGVVTEAKEQGKCGSCWAFSVVAAVETAYAVKTGKLTSLSEQQLVDCIDAENACKGNTISSAYNLIMKQGGSIQESIYPYISGTTGTPSECKEGTISKDGRAKIENFLGVAPNEAAIEAAVAIQPLSAIVRTGSTPGWLLYGGGVYDGECGTKPDHGVAIVGYGEEDGQKYWIIKNSWGTSWGENGFMKLKRSTADSTGLCGINQYPARPLMAGFNVADYPANAVTTSGVRSYPKKKWSKRLLTLTLSVCADACEKEQNCKYFSRLGCNKLYSDGTNCELVDGTDMGLFQDPTLCGDSGSLPGRETPAPEVSGNPASPPPRRSPPKKPAKRPPPKRKSPPPGKKPKPTGR